MVIFNQKLLRTRKKRLAIKTLEFNFLKKELAQRTVERLLEIKGLFPNLLEIGSGLGELQAAILEQNLYNKFPNLLQSDYSLHFLQKNTGINKINLDSEFLPFKNNIFDGIISILTLHSMNDLPSIFSQIYKSVKTSGFFFLVMPTIGTLHELKLAMAQAEMELFSGQSPHIHPFLDMQTIANMLQSAGFKAITADKDKIEIMYKNFNSIFKDLKDYGETNVLLNKSPYYLGKKYFNLVEKKYSAIRDTKNNHYPATLEYCNIIGWKE